jgi:hypothetical protein
MPKINHDAAVKTIEIKCALRVAFGIHPKRLKRTIER